MRGRAPPRGGAGGRKRDGRGRATHQRGDGDEPAPAERRQDEPAEEGLEARAQCEEAAHRDDVARVRGGRPALDEHRRRDGEEAADADSEEDARRHQPAEARRRRRREAEDERREQRAAVRRAAAVVVGDGAPEVRARAHPHEDAAAHHAERVRRELHLRGEQRQDERHHVHLHPVGHPADAGDDEQPPLVRAELGGREGALDGGLVHGARRNFWLAACSCPNSCQRSGRRSCCQTGRSRIVQEYGTGLTWSNRARPVICRICPHSVTKAWPRTRVTSSCRGCRSRRTS